MLPFGADVIKIHFSWLWRISSLLQPLLRLWCCCRQCSSWKVREHVLPFGADVVKI
jgi:hypothetical protein